MCGVTSRSSHSGLTGFDFSRALATVSPGVVTLFGPGLRETAIADFQRIAAAVMAEDYAAVTRLSHGWGSVFDALGATPLVAHVRTIEEFSKAGDANGIARSMGPMREDLLHFYVALCAILDDVNAGLTE